MSKTDSLKEELGWRKIVFAILIATDVSLITWIAQNYGAVRNSNLAFSLLGVVFVTVGVIWLNRSAMLKFKDLEKE